jgi:flagellar basal body-associated protein FliL
LHKEQQRQRLKSNSIIPKLVVIVLSIVLLTGISLVPTLQDVAYGQSQQQAPQQQKQVGLSQVIKQIAEQVANANPGTNATNAYQVLLYN